MVSIVRRTILVYNFQGLEFFCLVVSYVWFFFSSVRDVIFQNFENYKPDVRELVCVADHLGSMMQYETPGFLPNKRIHRGILKDLGKFDWGGK